MNQKFIYKLILISILLFGISGCKRVLEKTLENVNKEDKGACIAGNCENGEGVWIWANGDKYSGEWKDKKKHGLGWFEYIAGHEYRGYRNEDLKEGFGVTNFTGDAVYIGEYKENHLEGFGIYITENKTSNGLWVFSEEKLKDGYCFIYDGGKKGYACFIDDGSMTLEETVSKLKQKHAKRIKAFQKKYNNYIDSWVPGFNE